jgi:hypothetical protein
MPLFQPVAGALRRVRRAACLLLPVALLAACATLSTALVKPGQSEAEMVAVMGQPTGRYALAGGVQRVEYAKGPYGKVTYMVELDGDGRVKSVEQVLSPQNFAKVRNGMSSQELLQLLGRPSDRARERGDRETWSWRYETSDCLWARVTVGEGRTFGGLSMMPDPHCDPLY